MIKALILLLLPVTAMAGLEKDAYEMYSLKNLVTTKSTVNVLTLPTLEAVRQRCDLESTKRGKGKFGYKIDACTFWERTPLGNSCTIVIPEKTNNDTLGHEVRHCFQGDFH